MPKHEFGIMKNPPKSGKRYDRYEPDKYDCIRVDDGSLSPLMDQLSRVKCYWHTPDRPGFGLADHGITLIPPESLDSILEILENRPDLSELSSLLSAARREGAFVIHFGI